MTTTATDEIWTTRDGRKLTVGEMDPDHVRNCLRMVIRNRRRFKVTCRRLLDAVALLELKRMLAFVGKHADDDGFEHMLDADLGTDDGGHYVGDT